MIKYICVAVITFFLCCELGESEYYFKIIQLSPFTEGRTKQYQELLKLFFQRDLYFNDRTFNPEDIYTCSKIRTNTPFLQSRDIFHV